MSGQNGRSQPVFQSQAVGSSGEPLHRGHSEVRRTLNRDLAPDPTRRYFNWSETTRYHHPSIRDLHRDQVKLGGWTSRQQRSGDPSPRYRGSRVIARNTYRRPSVKTENRSKEVSGRRRRGQWTTTKRTRILQLELDARLVSNKK